MRTFAVALLASLACLTPGAPAGAQEDHDLTLGQHESVDRTSPIVS